MERGSWRTFCKHQKSHNNDHRRRSLNANLPHNRERFLCHIGFTTRSIMIRCVFVLTMRTTALHRELLTTLPQSPERATDFPANQATQEWVQVSPQNITERKRDPRNLSDKWAGSEISSQPWDLHQCSEPQGSQGWGSGMWLAEPDGKAAEWAWKLHRHWWRWRWCRLYFPARVCLLLI